MTGTGKTLARLLVVLVALQATCGRRCGKNNPVWVLKTWISAGNVTLNWDMEAECTMDGTEVIGIGRTEAIALKRWTGGPRGTCGRLFCIGFVDGFFGNVTKVGDLRIEEGLWTQLRLCEHMLDVTDDFGWLFKWISGTFNSTHPLIVPGRETDTGLVWQSRDGAPAVETQLLGNTEDEMETLPPAMGSLRDDNGLDIAPGSALSRSKRESEKGMVLDSPRILLRENSREKDRVKRGVEDDDNVEPTNGTAQENVSEETDGAEGVHRGHGTTDPPQSGCSENCAFNGWMFQPKYLSGVLGTTWGPEQMGLYVAAAEAVAALCPCMPNTAACPGQVYTWYVLNAIVECVAKTNTDLFDAFLKRTRAKETDLRGKATWEKGVDIIDSDDVKHLETFGFDGRTGTTYLGVFARMCGTEALVALDTFRVSGLALRDTSKMFWDFCPGVGKTGFQAFAKCLVAEDCADVKKSDVAALIGSAQCRACEHLDANACKAVERFGGEFDDLCCRAGNKHRVFTLSSTAEMSAPVSSYRWDMMARGTYRVTISPAFDADLVLMFHEDLAMINYLFDGCIHLHTVLWGQPADFVVVESRGCSAQIGQTKAGWHFINMNRNCWVANDTLLHELSHAWGRKHEHCRMDRDDFVEVVDGISPDMIHNMDKFSWRSPDEVLPYDIQSHMHYDERFVVSKSGNAFLRFVTTMDVWKDRIILGCNPAFICYGCNDFVYPELESTHAIPEAMPLRNRRRLEGVAEGSEHQKVEAPAGAVVDMSGAFFWSDVVGQGCPCASELVGNALPEAIFGKKPGASSVIICQDSCWKHKSCNCVAHFTGVEHCLEARVPTKVSSVVLVESKKVLTVYIKADKSVFVLTHKDVSCQGMRLEGGKLTIGDHVFQFNVTKPCRYRHHKLRIVKSDVVDGIPTFYVSDYLCRNTKNTTKVALGVWHKDCLTMKTHAVCKEARVVPEFSMWDGTWRMAVKVVATGALAIINPIAGVVLGASFVVHGVYGFDVKTNCVPHIPEIVGNARRENEWIKASLGFTMITTGQCVRFYGPEGVMAELVFTDAEADMGLRPVGAIPTDLRSDIKTQYSCRGGNTELHERKTFGIDECAFWKLGVVRRWSHGLADAYIPCGLFGEVDVGHAFYIPCNVHADEYAYVYEPLTALTAPKVHYGANWVGSVSFAGNHSFDSSNQLVIGNENTTITIDFVRAQYPDVRKVVSYREKWYHCPGAIDDNIISHRPSMNTSWIVESVLDLAWHYEGKMHASVSYRKDLFEQVLKPYCVEINEGKLAPYLSFKIDNDGYNRTAEGKVAPWYISAYITFASKVAVTSERGNCTADVKIEHVDSADGSGYIITTMVVSVANTSGMGQLTLSTGVCHIMGPTIHPVEDNSYDVAMRCGLRTNDILEVTVCNKKVSIPFTVPRRDWTWDAKVTYNKIANAFTTGTWDSTVSWFNRIGTNVGDFFRGIGGALSSITGLLGFVWKHFVAILLVVLGGFLAAMVNVPLGVAIVGVGIFDMITGIAEAASFAEQCEHYEWLMLWNMIMLVCILKGWISFGFAAVAWVMSWLVGVCWFQAMWLECGFYKVERALTVCTEFEWFGYYFWAICLSILSREVFNLEGLMVHVVGRLNRWTSLFLDLENWYALVEKSVAMKMWILETVASILCGITQVVSLFAAGVLSVAIGTGITYLLGIVSLSVLTTWTLFRPTRVLRTLRLAKRRALFKNENLELDCLGARASWIDAPKKKRVRFEDEKEDLSFEVVDRRRKWKADAAAGPNVSRFSYLFTRTKNAYRTECVDSLTKTKKRFWSFHSERNSGMVDKVFAQVKEEKKKMYQRGDTLSDAPIQRFLVRPSYLARESGTEKVHWFQVPTLPKNLWFCVTNLKRGDCGQLWLDHYCAPTRVIDHTFFGIVNGSLNVWDSDKNGFVYRMDRRTRSLLEEYMSQEDPILRGKIQRERKRRAADLPGPGIAGRRVPGLTNYGPAETRQKQRQVMRLVEEDDEVERMETPPVTDEEVEVDVNIGRLFKTEKVQSGTQEKEELFKSELDELVDWISGGARASRKLFTMAKKIKRWSESRRVSNTRCRRNTRGKGCSEKEIRDYAKAVADAYDWGVCPFQCCDWRGESIGTQAIALNPRFGEDLGEETKIRRGRKAPYNTRKELKAIARVARRAAWLRNGGNPKRPRNQRHEVERRAWTALAEWVENSVVEDQEQLCAWNVVDDSANNGTWTGEQQVRLPQLVTPTIEVEELTAAKSQHFYEQVVCEEETPDDVQRCGANEIDIVTQLVFERFEREAMLEVVDLSSVIFCAAPTEEDGKAQEERKAQEATGARRKETTPVEPKPQRKKKDVSFQEKTPEGIVPVLSKELCEGALVYHVKRLVDHVACAAGCKPEPQLPEANARLTRFYDDVIRLSEKTKTDVTAIVGKAQSGRHGIIDTVKSYMFPKEGPSYPTKKEGDVTPATQKPKETSLKPALKASAIPQTDETFWRKKAEEYQEGLNKKRGQYTRTELARTPFLDDRVVGDKVVAEECYVYKNAVSDEVRVKMSSSASAYVKEVASNLKEISPEIFSNERGRIAVALGCKPAPQDLDALLDKLTPVEYRALHIRAQINEREIACASGSAKAVKQVLGGNVATNVRWRECGDVAKKNLNTVHLTPTREAPRKEVPDKRAAKGLPPARSRSRPPQLTGGNDEPVGRQGRSFSRPRGERAVSKSPGRKVNPRGYSPKRPMGDEVKILSEPDDKPGKFWVVNGRKVSPNEKLKVNHTTANGPGVGKVDFTLSSNTAKISDRFGKNVSFGGMEHQAMGLVDIEGWEYYAYDQIEKDRPMIVGPGWSGVPLYGRPISAIDSKRKRVYVCMGTKVLASDKLAKKRPTGWVMPPKKKILAESDDESSSSEYDVASVSSTSSHDYVSRADGIGRAVDSYGIWEQEDNLPVKPEEPPNERGSFRPTGCGGKSVPIYKIGSDEYVIRHYFCRDFVGADVEHLAAPPPPIFAKRKSLWLRGVTISWIDSVLYSPKHNAFWMMYKCLGDVAENERNLRGRCGSAPSIGNRPFTGYYIEKDQPNSMAALFAIYHEDLGCFDGITVRVAVADITFCMQDPDEEIDTSEKTKISEETKEVYANARVTMERLIALDGNKLDESDDSDYEESEDCVELGEEFLMCVVRLAHLLHKHDLVNKVRKSFIEASVMQFDWDLYKGGDTMRNNWEYLLDGAANRDGEVLFDEADLSVEGQDSYGLASREAERWWNEFGTILTTRFQDKWFSGYNDIARPEACIIWILLKGGAEDIEYLMADKFAAASGIFQSFLAEKDQHEHGEIAAESIRTYLSEQTGEIFPQRFEYGFMEKVAIAMNNVEAIPGDPSLFEGVVGYMKILRGVDSSWGFIDQGALYTTYHGTMGKALIVKVDEKLMKFECTRQDASRDICVYGAGSRNGPFAPCVKDTICFVFDPETDTKRYFKKIDVNTGGFGDIGDGTNVRSAFLAIKSGSDPTLCHRDYVSGHSGLPIARVSDGAIVGMVSSISKAHAMAQVPMLQEMGVVADTIITVGASQMPPGRTTNFESDCNQIMLKYMGSGGCWDVIARLGSGKSTRLPYELFKTLKNRKKNGSVRMIILNPIRKATSSLVSFMTREKWYSDGVLTSCIGGDALPDIKVGKDCVIYMTYGKFIESFEALSSTKWDAVFLDEIHMQVMDSDVFTIHKCRDMINAKVVVTCTATDINDTDAAEVFPDELCNFRVDVDKGLQVAPRDKTNGYIMLSNYNKTSYRIPKDSWDFAQHRKGVVLVYCQGVQQCTAMASFAQSAHPHILTATCTSQTDFAEFEALMQANPQKMRVVFCTDCIENGVTISDVVGVVHLGTTSKPGLHDEPLEDTNGRKFHYAGMLKTLPVMKMNLVQALGRVGRKSEGFFIHFRENLGDYSTRAHFKEVEANTEAEALPKILTLRKSVSTNVKDRYEPVFLKEKDYKEFCQRFSDYAPFWKYSGVPMWYAWRNGLNNALISDIFKDCIIANIKDHKYLTNHVPPHNNKSGATHYVVEHFEDPRSETCMKRSKKNEEAGSSLWEAGSAEKEQSGALVAGITAAVLTAGVAFVTTEACFYVGKHALVQCSEVYYVKDWASIAARASPLFWDETNVAWWRDSWVFRKLSKKAKKTKDSKDYQEVRYKAIKDSEGRGKWVVDKLTKTLETMASAKSSTNLVPLVEEDDEPDGGAEVSEEAESWVYCKWKKFTKKPAEAFKSWMNKKEKELAKEEGTSGSHDIWQAFFTLGNAISSGNIEVVPAAQWAIATLGPVAAASIGALWPHLCNALSPAGAGAVLFFILMMLIGTQSVAGIGLLVGTTFVSYLCVAGLDCNRDKIRGRINKAPGVTLMIAGGLGLWVHYISALVPGGNLFQSAAISSVAFATSTPQLELMVKGVGMKEAAGSGIFGQLYSALNWLGFDNAQMAYVGQFSTAAGTGASIALALLRLEQRSIEGSWDWGATALSVLMDGLAGGPIAIMVGVAAFVVYKLITKLSKKTREADTRLAAFGSRNKEAFEVLNEFASKRTADEVVKTIATVICVALNPLRLVTGCLYTLYHWIMGEEDLGKKALAGFSYSPLVAVMLLLMGTGKKVYNYARNRDNGEMGMSSNAISEFMQSAWETIKNGPKSGLEALWGKLCAFTTLCKDSGLWILEKMWSKAKEMVTRCLKYSKNYFVSQLWNNVGTSEVGCSDDGAWIWSLFFIGGMAAGSLITRFINWWNNGRAVLWHQGEVYCGTTRVVHDLTTDAMKAEDEGCFCVRQESLTAARWGNCEVAGKLVAFAGTTIDVGNHFIMNKVLHVRCNVGRTKSIYRGNTLVCMWTEADAGLGCKAINYAMKTKDKVLRAICLSYFGFDSAVYIERVDQQAMNCELVTSEGGWFSTKRVSFECGVYKHTDNTKVVVVPTNSYTRKWNRIEAGSEYLYKEYQDESVTYYGKRGTWPPMWVDNPPEGYATWRNPDWPVGMLPFGFVSSGAPVRLYGAKHIAALATDSETAAIELRYETLEKRNMYERVIPDMISEPDVRESYNTRDAESLVFDVHRHLRSDTGKWKVSIRLAWRNGGEEKRYTISQTGSAKNTHFLNLIYSPSEPVDPRQSSKDLAIKGFWCAVRNGMANTLLGEGKAKAVVRWNPVTGQPDIDPTDPISETASAGRDLIASAKKGAERLGTRLKEIYRDSARKAKNKGGTTADDLKAVVQEVEEVREEVKSSCKTPAKEGGENENFYQRISRQAARFADLPQNGTLRDAEIIIGDILEENFGCVSTAKRDDICVQQSGGGTVPRWFENIVCDFANQDGNVASMGAGKVCFWVDEQGFFVHVYGSWTAGCRVKAGGKNVEKVFSNKVWLGQKPSKGTDSKHRIPLQFSYNGIRPGKECVFLSRNPTLAPDSEDMSFTQRMSDLGSSIKMLFKSGKEYKRLEEDGPDGAEDVLYDTSAAAVHIVEHEVPAAENNVVDATIAEGINSRHRDVRASLLPAGPTAPPEEEVFEALGVPFHDLIDFEDEVKFPAGNPEVGTAGGVLTFGVDAKLAAQQDTSRRVPKWGFTRLAPWVMHCRPCTAAGMENVIWYDGSRQQEVDLTAVYPEDITSIRRALLTLSHEQYNNNVRAGTFLMPRKTDELSVGYFKMKQFLEDFPNLDMSRVWDSTSGSGGFVQAINEKAKGSIIVASTKRNQIPLLSPESLEERGNTIQVCTYDGLLGSIMNKSFQNQIRKDYPNLFSFVVWDAGEGHRDALKENAWLLFEERIDGLRFLADMVAPGGSLLLKLKGLWYTAPFIESLCRHFGRACAWFCPTRRTNSQEWYLVLNRKKESTTASSAGYWRGFITSVQKALVRTMWDGYNATLQGLPPLGRYEPIIQTDISARSRVEHVGGVNLLRGGAGLGWDDVTWDGVTFPSYTRENWEWIRNHPKMRGRILPVGNQLKHQRKVCSLKGNRRGGANKVHYNPTIRKYVTGATSWNIGASTIGIASREPNVIQEAIESRLDQPITDIKIADLELLDRAFRHVLRNVPDEHFEPMSYDKSKCQLNRKGAIGILDDHKIGGKLGDWYDNPSTEERVCKKLEGMQAGMAPPFHVTIMEKYEKKERKNIENGFLSLKGQTAGSQEHSGLMKSKEWIAHTTHDWEERNKTLFNKDFFSAPRLIRYGDADFRLIENMLYGNATEAYTRHEVIKESFAGETWTACGKRLHREYDEMAAMHGADNVAIGTGDFSKCDHHQNKQDCAVEGVNIAKKFKKVWQKAVRVNYAMKSEAVQIADFGVFITNGQRLSGEKLTSMGNTIKVDAYLYACISKILGWTFEKISECLRIGVDGDDWFVIGPKDSIQLICRMLHRVIKMYGHSLRTGSQEGVMYHPTMETVDFRSHRYVKQGVHVFPWRSMSTILAKLTLTCKAAGYLKDHQDHILVTASTALSYLLMYPASIVVRHICLAVLAETGIPEGVMSSVERKMAYKMGRWNFKTVADAIKSVWEVEELGQIPFLSPNVEGVELDRLTRNILFVSRRVRHQIRTNVSQLVCKILLKQVHSKEVVSLCPRLATVYRLTYDRDKSRPGLSFFW